MKAQHPDTCALCGVDGIHVGDDIVKLKRPLRLTIAPDQWKSRGRYEFLHYAHSDCDYHERAHRTEWHEPTDEGDLRLGVSKVAVDVLRPGFAPCNCRRCRLKEKQP